jgi:hypothetical protein
VQNRHAGIKAVGGGNEKRGEEFYPQINANKAEMQRGNFHGRLADVSAGSLDRENAFHRRPALCVEAVRLATGNLQIFVNCHVCSKSSFDSKYSQKCLSLTDAFQSFAFRASLLHSSSRFDTLFWIQLPE